MVPPAAIAPVASRSLYPKRRISGSATRPMVAAVASDEPHTAPNAAQAEMLAWARPARLRLSHRLNAA